MRASILVSIVGALVCAGGVYAADERLLFDNPDYEVTVAEDVYCGEPVAVTVRSKRPELFEAVSPELQRIADATRAVLGFECPDVGAVEIEGRLSGLGDPVYFGVAERRTNWELAVRQSIQSEEYREHEAPLVEGDGYRSTDEGSGFTVANLFTGMSVDEALAAVDETFGVEPEYDASTGILTMHAGGCPDDYDWASLSPSPELGWKCLRAWFTDQRMARLYLLDLVQVIEASELELVQRQLIDRFGEPSFRATRERETRWWKRDDTTHVMGWGEIVESIKADDTDETEEVYNLQAKVLQVGEVTIVTITLYQPDIRPGWASDEPNPTIPGLTL